MDATDPRLTLQAAIDSLQQQSVRKQSELDRLVQELRQIQQSLARLTMAVETINEFIPGSPLPAPRPSSSPKTSGQCPSLFNAPGDGDEQPPAGSPDLFDLTGKTALDSALVILKERAPNPVHFRDVATEAVGRGYRSPKGNKDIIMIERTFWDTMRRAKAEIDVPIVFDNEGRFRYDPNKQASYLNDGDNEPFG